ncbi:MAG: hypothetical protein GY828_01300 [Candidatus Gracilibacteria bacterium]|nr:hypothetical protein [Candidatus Gracilibacteria bacterium]
MRISVLEQVKAFLRREKKNNTYVYTSKEMKLTIKNYLIKEKMLYAPIRGIYIIKKQNQFNGDVLEKYKFEVLSKLGGVITGNSAIAYYLGEIFHVKNFKIITKNKNFKAKLGEHITLEFTASTVERITQKYTVENSEILLESPLSLYINNYKNIPENSDYIRYLMNIDISHKTIDELIHHNFKISGISKLALLYKKNGFTGKHKIILNALREAGKQIDYRKAHTQVKNTKNTLSDFPIEDLDSLI